MHLLGPALQSWDGRRPEPIQVNGTGPSDRPSASDEVDLTTLALAPSTGDAEGWDIRWRFRASGQGNACFMIVDGARLQARLERWGNFWPASTILSGMRLNLAVVAAPGESPGDHFESWHGTRRTLDLVELVERGFQPRTMACRSSAFVAAYAGTWIGVD